MKTVSRAIPLMDAIEQHTPFEDGTHEQVFENVMVEILPNGLDRLGGLGQRLVRTICKRL